MSESLLQFLERAVAAADRSMTLIQKREYHPQVEVVRQTRTDSQNVQIAQPQQTQVRAS